MQLLRFLLVGSVNTGIGLLCIFTAMWLFELDYRLANAIGYTIGSGIGFVLNRSWTFGFQGAWWGSLMRWSTVVALAFAFNLVAVIGLHQGLHAGVYLAQFGGVAAYTAIAFLGGRHFAFRGSRQTTCEGAA